MPFNDAELEYNLALIEELFWSRRRPPLRQRSKPREGQRVAGNIIELFYARLDPDEPGGWRQEPIARLRWFPRGGYWRLYFRRADARWHPYRPCPQAGMFADALEIIADDAHRCFFG